MGYIVKVDKEKCVGCGACVSICGKYFDLDPEGKSEYRGENPVEELDCIENAANICPMNAIEIIKED